MTHMLSFQLEKPLTKKTCTLYIYRNLLHISGLFFLVYGQSQVDSSTSVYLSKGESYVDPNKLNAVFVH